MRHLFSIRGAHPFWLLAIIWTLVVALSYGWAIYKSRAGVVQEAVHAAQVLYEREHALRQWLSRHGGVYIALSEEVQPDPFSRSLVDRDITTPSGRSLTLVPPARLLRILFDTTPDSLGAIRRLISTKPLNPANTPDPWEQQALQEFQTGGLTEKRMIADINGKPHLRMMRPNIMKEACLGCHAGMGFQVGDVGGGVSISIPMQRLDDLFSHAVLLLSIGHGGFWLLGLAGVYVGTRKLIEKDRQRERDYYSQRALFQVLETSMEKGDFHKQLGHVLDHILNTPWLALENKAVIFLMDHASNQLRLAAQRNVAESLLTDCAQVAMGECLCGRAAEAREVVFKACIDDHHEHRYAGIKNHGHYVMPILLQDELLGVLTLYVGAHHQYDEDEVRFLKAVCNSLANIIHRHNAEEKLHERAFYDVLTGLPNRALFVDRLERCIKRKERHPEYLFAVMFLDLDRFKTINDSLGHEAGDQVLKTVAQRLLGCVRDGDTVSRLGGDEFTIILDDITGVLDVTHVSERIHASITEPIMLGEQELFSAVSIGAVIVDDSDASMDELLRDADTAMYKAKASGSGKTEIYNTEMHSHAVELLNIETELHHAIANDEFELYYQPIVEGVDGVVVGFEALVRWHHPQRGLVMPDEFIPMAEEIGLIGRIDMWVLREACRQLRAWQDSDAGFADLYMGVNLSAQELVDEQLLANIETVLEESGIDPGKLHLEITESVFVSDPDVTNHVLLELKARGVTICIDDFGTGYSSLMYLQYFPFDILKIDRMFISNLDQDGGDKGLVEAVVTIARNMGMQVIAEGVEKETHLQSLRELNCNTMQGYYFHRPMSVADIEKVMSGTRAALPGQE